MVAGQPAQTAPHITWDAVFIARRRPHARLRPSTTLPCGQPHRPGHGAVGGGRSGSPRSSGRCPTVGIGPRRSARPMAGLKGVTAGARKASLGHETTTGEWSSGQNHPISPMSVHEPIATGFDCLSSLVTVCICMQRRPIRPHRNDGAFPPIDTSLWNPFHTSRSVAHTAASAIDMPSRAPATRHRQTSSTHPPAALARPVPSSSISSQ